MFGGDRCYNIFVMRSGYTCCFSDLIIYSLKNSVYVFELHNKGAVVTQNARNTHNSPESAC